MFFNYKEFSDWYAAKFQRSNPLPWQDGMNAILYYLSKSVPDNTRVFITVSDNPTGVTISGKGIESDPYIWSFNFNKSEIKGPQGPQGEQGPQGPQGEPGPGLDNIVSLDITPTFTVGGVAVEQTAGNENIAVDIKYGIDGKVPQIEGVLTLPFKAGNGIIIDVDEENKRIVFKSTGGKLYLHTITMTTNNTENVPDIVFSFYSSQSTPFTLNSFIQAFGDSGTLNSYPLPILAKAFEGLDTVVVNRFTGSASITEVLVYDFANSVSINATVNTFLDVVKEI